MPCFNKLSPKAPSEKVVVTFDFSPALNAGEVLTTFVSRSIATIAGEDSNAAAVLDGAQVLNVQGTMVNQGVQAGVNGCYYEITMVYDTSEGHRFEVDAILPVLE